MAMAKNLEKDIITVSYGNATRRAKTRSNPLERMKGLSVKRMGIVLPFVFFLLLGPFTAFCASDKPGADPWTEIASLLPNELAELILKEASMAEHGKDKASLRWRIAVDTLCRSKSTEAAEEVNKLLRNCGLSGEVKKSMLLELGTQGAKGCVDIITEFESWAETTSKSPPPFNADEQRQVPNGMTGFGQHIDGMAENVDPHGNDWVVMSLSWQSCGAPSSWIVRRIHDNDWTRPTLCQFPGKTPASGAVLTGGAEVFSLKTTSGETVGFNMSEVTKDSDEDGAPDLLERYLGTDPTVADSDGDGIPDGKDTNPLTPPCKNFDADKRAIRQAVFTTLVAPESGWTRVYLYADERSGLREEPQEFHGYGGPILWTTKWVPKETIITVKFIRMVSTSEAKVEVNFNSSLDERHIWGFGYRCTVKRLHGRWITTGSTTHNWES